MKQLKNKAFRRIRRAWRVRKKVRGTAERPRLTVFRSNKHIYAQVIDDVTGATLASASSRDKNLRPNLPGGKSTNVAAATFVGEQLAARAKEKGIEKIAFDRGPYKFHGRVKALAEAARKAGLQF